MQSEIESIQRLKNPKYKVSCHYLINRKGKIYSKKRKVLTGVAYTTWKKQFHFFDKERGDLLKQLNIQTNNYFNYDLKSVERLLWHY